MTRRGEAPSLLALHAKQHVGPPAPDRRAGRTPSVFYASRTPATAVAEMAFHRLLFFAESPETPWPSNAGEYTVFAAEVRTQAALNLTKPPFGAHPGLWTHPTDYRTCQLLADTGRAAGIDALRYESTRDPARGTNLAVLTCRPFVSPAPVDRQTWRLEFGPFGVRALCAFPEARHAFGREAFAGDPRIAALTWERDRRSP